MPIMLRNLPILKHFKSVINSLASHNFIYAVPFLGHPFNNTVRQQDANPKSVPIIIISFNQLFYLRQLIDFLKKTGHTNIVILDNVSDYAPLLEYYEELGDSVKIYRMKKNFGHRAFWYSGEVYDRYRKGYFVITDPDIVPCEDCPADFLTYFKKLLDKNPFVKKVGFSLELEDIPDTHPQRQKVVDWESQFWKKKTPNGDYSAIIDTTFALYRPESGLFKYTNFFRGIRAKRPYTARHGGWYIDPKNMTDEQVHYYKKATSSSTWRFDADGNLVCDMYTREKSPN